MEEGSVSSDPMSLKTIWGQLASLIWVMWCGLWYGLVCDMVCSVTWSVLWHGLVWSVTWSGLRHGLICNSNLFHDLADVVTSVAFMRAWGMNFSNGFQKLSLWCCEKDLCRRSEYLLLSPIINPLLSRNKKTLNPRWYSPTTSPFPSHSLFLPPLAWPSLPPPSAPLTLSTANYHILERGLRCNFFKQGRGVWRMEKAPGVGAPHFPLFRNSLQSDAPLQAHSQAAPKIELNVLLDKKNFQCTWLFDPNSGLLEAPRSLVCSVTSVSAASRSLKSHTYQFL